LVSAATTGDQARIVWGIAKRMVEKTPDLRENYAVQAFANSIARFQNGGTIKPINAKASTQDGLNPSALCFDELHAHKSHDLFNVLRSAAGARNNPLFLYTTTEGYETPGPWPEERHFAKQILDGVIKAEHYLALIFAIDDEDEDFDESKWIKANPLMLVNKKLAEKIQENAMEAKQKPGSLSEFRIKRLNRQSATATGFVNLHKWNKCAGKVPLDELVGVKCWGAFDLASTTDMCSWFLLWLKDGVFYTHGRYWVPSDAVYQRSVRGTVNYQGWVQAGYLTVTDGDVTDYRVIEQDIMADWERFAPQAIAYDPWNATSIVNRLIDNGVPAASDKDPRGLQQFIQGPRSYNGAMKAFESAYISGRLRHGGNPVLTWNASNLVPRMDVNMNLAPDKKRSAEKIDGIACLIMAFGLSQAEVEKPKYQVMFV
jgi:phage terminase large subunit-like protein